MTPRLFAIHYWDAIRPQITAVLAVSQVSPLYFPTFPGPISPTLEERLANFQATVNKSLSQLHQKHARRSPREVVPLQCQDPQRDHCFQDEVHMSQGPGVSCSPSSPFENNSGQILPGSRESRTLPPIIDNYNVRNIKAVAQSPDAAANALTPALQTQRSSEPRSSRPIELLNLLNPAAREPLESQSRRRNADHFDMPSSSLFATGPRMLPTSFASSPGVMSLPSITPPPMNHYSTPMDQASRRTLTPRSPSAYASTPTSFNIRKGTIDAKKSPFGASRELSSILGPEIQNVPETSLGPPSVGTPHGYSAPFARSPPARRTSAGSVHLQSSVERRASIGATSQLHASQSDSPTTSYSSYSQFSRTPPVPLSNTSGNQPASSGYFPPPYNATNSASTISPAGFDSKESYSPVTSSMGQNTYQMTLDTDQGPIQVPVDVQAASKVADEKRKRNATASHRFRQRRKEKERETSQNIAKLEHQLREMAEEREFYRMERDFYRSLAKSNPGHAQIAPRPPSPRHLRHSQLSGAASYTNSQWQAPEEGNRNGRNTRRRTSSYVPPQGLVPPQSLAPPINNPPPHLSRHPHVPSNPSESTDPGNRNRLSAPVSLKAGSFDLNPPAGYDSGWKPGQ